MTTRAPGGAGRRFQPGQSGNPAGRPKGARNHATILLEKMMHGDAEEIGKSVIAAAKAGDPTAMRLCVERLYPVRKGAPVVFDMPPIVTAADVDKATGELMRQTAAGELSPEEAATIAQVLEVRRRAIETAELEARIAALEAKGSGEP